MPTGLPGLWVRTRLVLAIIQSLLVLPGLKCAHKCSLAGMLTKDPGWARLVRAHPARQWGLAKVSPWQAGFPWYHCFKALTRCPVKASEGQPEAETVAFYALLPPAGNFQNSK